MLNQSEKIPTNTQQERFAVIGEMTLCVIHDIATPISVLSNCLELINIKYENGQYDTIQRDLEILKRTIKKMTRQTQDILDFIKNNPMNLEMHDVSKIIFNVITELNVSKRITVNTSGDTTILCDQTKLETMFANLITNSIQATQNDDSKIKIRITEQEENIKIEIEDSGPEIPHEILEKMFVPLFTTKSFGTGLGLVSCKHIVDEHNGTISVSTNPTTFTIILPKANYSR